MAIRNFAKYGVLALVAMACTVKEPLETQAPTNSEPVVSDEGYIPGRAIVEFDDALTSAIETELAQGAGVTTKSMGSVMDQLGIIEMERVFPHAGEFEPRTRAMGLHHFYTVSYSEATPVSKALATLEAMPGVVSVSPSRPIAKRVTFNDPLFGNQWHYINSDYSGADINVKGVWDKYTTGSNKVIVCVVDEPIDATHEDLKDNLWQDASGHTGYNYARNNYDMTIRPENGNGDQGHGTHVAGTISAVNNNGIGLCGIAGGNKAAGVQGVLLMSHGIFSGTKSASDANTYKAIKDAADKGAVISQNSWGYYADANGDGRVSSKELADYKKQTEDSAMAAAIEYFVKNAGCDANGNQRSDSPMKGGLVIFAAGNENIEYDVVGSNDPNVIEVGAFRETGAKASYSNWGDWVHIAAPGGEGNYSYDSVWSTLPTKVTSAGYGGQYWAGTSMACPHVSGVAALIISYFGGEGFTAEDAKKILFGGLGNTIGGSKPIGKKVDALASFEWALANGYTPGSAPIEPLPPVIHFSQESVSVPAHKTVEVTVTATDPNNDKVTLELIKDSANEAITLKENGSSWLLTIEAPKATAGQYEVSVKATDATGLSSSAKFGYVILENHAPKVAKTPDNQLAFVLNQTGGPLDVSTFFTDEDEDDVLKFTVSAHYTSFVDLKLDGSKLSWTPKSYGSTAITVTATDILGLSTSASFQLTAMPANENAVSYPSVAQNDAYVLIGTVNPTEVTVSLYNSLGGLVLRQTVTASMYEPIHLDLSKVAPGRYTAVIEGWGTTQKVRIVKY